MSENVIYLTKCSWCGGELRLLKDPKGRAFHHKCWVEFKKSNEKGGKND